MMCHRIGFPPISTIGLGFTSSFFAEARAESTRKNDGLHVCDVS